LKRSAAFSKGRPPGKKAGDLSKKPGTFLQGRPPFEKAGLLAKKSAARA
jgi:hypothetical protein